MINHKLLANNNNYYYSLYNHRVLNAGIVLIILVAFAVTYCDVRTFKNLTISMFSLITPCLWCWRSRTPQILFPVQNIELSPSNSEVDLIRMDVSSNSSSTSDAT